VRTRTRTEREGGVSGVRCGAGLPFFFSALREEKGVIEKFVVYFSSSWGLMSLCFCSSSHFSSSTLHIFSVCCFVAIYHTHPHSVKITNAYAYAHACLRTLSAFWIFCPYRRLTNGDALSHTVQDDDLAAVPLATPAGELKFNSLRVTGRGKNTRLSSHSTISLQNWRSHRRIFPFGNPARFPFFKKSSTGYFFPFLTCLMSTLFSSFLDS
jgi:hypothetical protein